jgi:AcrR family transcriptional regulator
MEKSMAPKPTPQRRQRKKLQTASHLSGIAFALFEKQGFDAVSMEHIAEQADVAKATLYSYFPVKEALLAHRFREDIAAGMAERAVALKEHRSFYARMRYLLAESAAWHAERRVYLPHYVRYLTSNAYGVRVSGQPSYATESMMILAGLVQAGQQSGEVSRSLSAERIALNLQFLLFAAMTAWLADPGQSLTTLFLSAFDVLMHGVAESPQVPSNDSVP